jgi:predicted phage terminase large subunit-like protein
VVPVLATAESESAAGCCPDAGWHVSSIAAAEIGRVEEHVQSWDCTFKNLETSDYIVGQVWGRRAPAFLLLDQVRGRMDFPETVSAVRRLSSRWTGTVAKLIEDKANGSAVIQMMAHEIPGILPVNPEGGKVARAAAVSPLVEAGNIFLPHPQRAPWVNDFIEECAAFPNGAHDDQVDAMTQALLQWNMVPRELVVVYDRPYVISPI